MKVVIDASFYNLLVDLKSILNVSVLPFLDFENIYYKRNALGELIPNIPFDNGGEDISTICRGEWVDIVTTDKVMIEVYDHDVIFSS